MTNEYEKKKKKTNNNNNNKTFSFQVSLYKPNMG